MRKFLSIFTTTAHYVRAVRRLERIEGRMSVARVAPFMGEWAKAMMGILQVEVEMTGAPYLGEPTIFVGNHVSYLDIPMLLSTAPVVFVAKRELGKWPVFGAALRVVGTVLVDRSSKLSRQEALQALGPRLLERRQSVVIFPSGTTTMDENRPWSWGAFTLAHRHNILIQPFRIRYRPMRRAAYLMEDSFAPHLWRLLRGGPLEAFVEYHPPVAVLDPEQDAKKWWDWSREGLYT